VEVEFIIVIVEFAGIDPVDPEARADPAKEKTETAIKSPARQKTPAQDRLGRKEKH
jgi:hypothetical protein